MYFIVKNSLPRAYSLLFNNNIDDNIYNITFNTNKNNKNNKKICIKKIRNKKK